MMKKTGKDYIVFALDVDNLEKATDLAGSLDGHVGMFKIGMELFIQEGPRVVDRIRQKSSAGIFLDLKLHDISATVHRAMARIADLGVDLVTVHCASSVRMLEKAVAGGDGKTGVLGVTLLTDNDQACLVAAGFKSEFSEDVQKIVGLRASMAHKAGCRGVVCSGQESAGIKKRFGTDFLAVTPGIRPKWSLTPGDDQKRITTPAAAVKAGSDLLVIGRPIRDAKDPAEAAGKVAQEIDTFLES